MLTKVLSGGVLGVDGFSVDVEVNISRGLPQFVIVGLPDTAVKESKERVKSALELTGIKFPSKKVLVNLAPANIPKQGTLYDLPIAIGILSNIGVIHKELSDTAFIGELSLDGKLRKVNGVLPVALHLKEKGIKNLILPEDNCLEASVVEGINVYGFSSLKEVIGFLNGEIFKEPARFDYSSISENTSYEDFADVKGQLLAKRAVTVAVAGFHNLLLIGSPGSGKTMIARRIPSILPDIEFEEAIQTTKIYSVAGLLDRPLILKRPMRFVHHTISDTALVGGGSVPKPGEISLAHNGVLFLDELPEFKRNSLEALRQPLEDKKIVISRANGKFEFPANFQLVATANPCPCGYRFDSERECSCSDTQVKRYLGKISGPLLDRIDIVVQITRPKTTELLEKQKSQSSKELKEQVLKAVEIQKIRFKNTSIKFNSQMSSAMVDRFVKLEANAESLLKMLSEKAKLTGRSFYKILKISRTIADLDNSEKVEKKHILEAFNFKVNDEMFGV